MRYRQGHNKAYHDKQRGPRINHHGKFVFQDDHRQPHIDVDGEQVLAHPPQCRIANPYLHRQHDHQHRKNDAQAIVRQAESVGRA